MTGRFFYSTHRAARSLHVSSNWFRMLAASAGEQPMIFEGRLAVRWMWSIHQVERLRALREAAV